MKLVAALSHLGFFRHFDGVVRSLAARGHETTLHLERQARHYLTDRALAAAERETPGLTVGPLLVGKGKGRRLRGLPRELLGYAVYLRAGHPSPRLAERWRESLAWPALGSLLRPWLATASGRATLRWWERGRAPEEAVTRFLEQARPDVVLAAPTIMTGSREVEYVKAAARLGIPTVVSVPSWDNLSSKGTFPVLPDRLLLWNRAMADEAVELHEVPRERVVETGAPFFDEFMDLRPSADAASVCRQVGIDPPRPYVMYLCSSSTITQNETEFVRSLARAMGPGSPALLIRPHPTTASHWKEFSEPGTAVWPRDGDVPDVPAAKQEYFDMLHHAVATVGINTSATLEAAIADRPCVTIMTAEHRAGQTEMGHFRHLEAGGFLEAATSLEGAAKLLAEIAAGRDARAAERRRFVKDFLRPAGMERRAAEVAADAIEELARVRVPA